MLSFRVVPITLSLLILNIPPLFVTFATNVSEVISLKLKSIAKSDLPFKFTLPRFVEVSLPSITFIPPALIFNEEAPEISAFGPNVIRALFKLI